MKGLFGLLLMCPFVLYLSVVFFFHVQMDINCLGHLKRAGDANTVKLAKQELQVAVKYLEDKRMTNGYTSIFYNTPNEDIGFWYQNLTASLDELNKLTDQSSQLETSNTLLKLRETLLDNGKQGVTVTCPDGLSRYPFNILFMFFGVFGLVLAVIGIVVLKDFLEND